MGKDSNFILTVTLFSTKNVSNRSQRSIRGVKSKVDGLGSKRIVPVGGEDKLNGPKDLKKNPKVDGSKEKDCTIRRNESGLKG